MEVSALKKTKSISRDSAAGFWEDILTELSHEMTLQSLKTWIYPCNPVNYIDGKMIIRVPSHFHYEWIESHYSQIIKSIAKRLFGDKVELEYVIPPRGEISENKITLSEEEIEDTKVDKYSEIEVVKKEVLPSFAIPLNPRYLFENYIDIKTNKFAKKSALKVSEDIGKTTFNPLYIYGNTGMGKTHLLHAIGNKIIQDHGLKVSYVTSEKFAFEYVSALKEKRLDKFIRAFRNVEVLIMDDIQFLSGKYKMQEEFFHAFKELFHLNKQIIVAADRPPSKLSNYEAGLLSRLQSGLIVDLQLPDYESRVEIIRKKCQADNVEIDDEVIDYIAANVKTNVRELEGIIIRMLAQSSLLEEDLNLDMAMKIIVSLAPHLKFGKNQNLNSILTVDDVLEVMAEVYAKPAALIKGPSRKRDIAKIRKMAVYCCKQFTDENMVSIAQSFDRSHAFVIYSIRDIEKILKNEPDLNYQVDKIKKMLISSKK